MKSKSAGAMSKRRRINIRKNDKARPLITETLPYETPVIFSSSGIYDHVKGVQESTGIEREFVLRLVMGSGPGGFGKWTVPLRYKIRKNSIEFRRLSLMHPRAQWKFSSLYGSSESLILHYCSGSPASIRAPQKVAGSFFRKGVWEDIHRFRTGSVSVVSDDERTRHTPSYFTYRGVDRLYKFFESRDYLELEKKYASYWTLDVSKCFDSIYTHSLSWAVKDKEFTKDNVGVRSTFAQEFDAAMQYANHSETNGIVIGPEVSRIFAEIIFQEIDRMSIARLLRDDMRFGEEYSFRRYVDDVLIFSRTEDISERVYKCYADVLSEFNLHANSEKSERIVRPFSTRKSRLIQRASKCTTEFSEKLLGLDEKNRVIPARIYSPWRMTRSFVESIKSICFEDNASYDEISAYVIGILAERVKKLVANRKILAGSEEEYLVVLSILLDVMYFLYGVSPSVTSSYKICSSVLLAVDFAKQNLPNQYPSLAQKIYDLTHSHLSEDHQRDADGVEGFLPLETLNVLLASRELGDNYLMSSKIVSEIFSSNSYSSIYFKATCCLFYIRSSPQFQVLRDRTISWVDEYFQDMSDIGSCSEKAYLFLDMVCCPYAPADRKAVWVKSAMQALGIPPASNVEVGAFVSASLASHWQIKWSDIDLLNLLEKKELRQVY